MIDVVCIGNALVDIIVNVPDSFIEENNLKKGTMTLSNDKEQKKLLKKINKFPKKIFTGGSSSNVSLGVSILGAKSCFIGKIGKDTNGLFFEKTLNKKNVITKINKSLNLNTGTAITLITEDGERTFSTHLGAANSLIEKDFLKIPKTKFLHIEAYLLENPELRKIILKKIKKIKKQGTKISLDLSDSSLIKRIKKELYEFIKNVNIVFANEQESKTFTEEESIKGARFLSNFCEIAIVKLGKQGSIIVSKNQQELINIEPVKPINTNGAGDAYAAGFLFGLSQNLDNIKAGKIASFLSKETVLVEQATVQKSLKKNIKKFL